jgi:pimeloyl-ACP methyl ester carboxylesterase
VSDGIAPTLGRARAGSERVCHRRPATIADRTVAGMRTLTVTTAAGDRQLAVAEAGAPDGVPVLRLHGTPGSGYIAPGDDALAAEHGIRLIGYDRPGYGGSTRRPGRTIADAVPDVRAIAAALEIDRLGVLGLSGGSPHALACAALAADLFPAAVLMSCRAPMDAEGLDWFAGMGEGNVEEFTTVVADPDRGLALLERERTGFLTAEPETLRDQVRSNLCEADARVLTAQFAADQLAAVKQGLAPGAEGWLDDDLTLCGDWGFSLEQVRSEVLFFHGRLDRFLPDAHAYWIASHVPGIDARIQDADGHLSLRPTHLAGAYRWLAARVG